MNINASLKIQNVRSLNLSLGIEITREKIEALTHESDDIIYIINTEIGKNTVFHFSRFIPEFF